MEVINNTLADLNGIIFPKMLDKHKLNRGRLIGIQGDNDIDNWL
jgi:hypothetical protein